MSKFEGRSLSVGGFLATLPGSGGNQCIMSCGSKQCNTDTGICQ